MGFVKHNVDLEGFFEKNKISWRMLVDKEYQGLMKKWCSSFENLLACGDVDKGGKALYLIQQKLPMKGGYVFNAPNNNFLSKTYGAPAPAPTFCYQFELMHEIDRELLNRCNAIVCDSDFIFMCSFNDEAPDLIPEMFCEINNSD